jgi:hypothetical protein
LEWTNSFVVVTGRSYREYEDLVVTLPDGTATSNTAGKTFVICAGTKCRVKVPEASANTYISSRNDLNDINPTKNYLDLESGGCIWLMYIPNYEGYSRNG